MWREFVNLENIYFIKQTLKKQIFSEFWPLAEL